LRETAPTWLPDYAVAEGKPLPALGVVALAFGLAKELSGEAAIERGQTAVCSCRGVPAVNLLGETRAASPPDAGKIYAQMLEDRYRGVNRCC
jgi:hypothetical protein